MVQPPQEAVKAPQPSQIPGLGDQTPYENNPATPQNVRDTDSAYIRLAKQGGRPDLHAIPDPNFFNSPNSGTKWHQAKLYRPN